MGKAIANKTVQEKSLKATKVIAKHAKNAKENIKMDLKKMV